MSAGLRRQISGERCWQVASAAWPSYRCCMTTLDTVSGMGVMSMRFEDDVDRAVQAAAAREGISVSEFVRAAVRERAERILSGASLWERIQPIIHEVERAAAADRLPTHFAHPI